MIFRIADNRDLTAIDRQGIAFRNRLRRIVCAFDLNVRTNLANQRPHIKLRKNNHGIHVRQRRNNFRPFFLRHHRTPLALQRPHRFVGIDTHNQFAAQCLCPAQIAHVPHVQQIKIPIAQNDALARAPPLLHALA